MQRLLLIGLNHTTAPLDVREKLAFAQTRSLLAVSQLQQHIEGVEVVILSTCNRVEIYLAAPREIDLVWDLAENLFTHMRMIRRKTIGEKHRAARSIQDHINIIEAIESRDMERAGELVRDHALGLADHVAKYADYLD